MAASFREKCNQVKQQAAELNVLHDYPPSSVRPRIESGAGYSGERRNPVVSMEKIFSFHFALFYFYNTNV